MDDLTDEQVARVASEPTETHSERDRAKRQAAVLENVIQTCLVFRNTTPSEFSGIPMLS
jgi:hypothetical protein